MKKNLLTIGILALGLSVQAQTVLLHVDDAAKMYVSEGTLVYNGGGLQTRGAGMIDLYGNMMIEASESNNDVVRTINTTSGPKLDGSNIVIRLNNPNAADPATYTYGQLYINGLTQGKVTAIVNKEYKNRTHGSPTGSYFQQIALPFFGKAISSLSTELNKTFVTQRFTQNEVLKFNNTLVVSDHYTNLASTTSDPTGYYMLGSKNGNLNISAPPASMPRIGMPATENGKVFTISGVPYASALSSTVPTITRTLELAGDNISFGSGGNAINQYLEKYNTYVQDSFETTDAGAWSTNYGKNIYQYGNPFLTNLDLSRIGYIESATTGDGNNITNVRGIRYDPGTVTTLSNGSTYSTGAKMITYPVGNVAPTGDIGMLIRPMQSFVIKLRSNAPQTLNFNTLRRFNYSIRADGMNYSVTAAKNGAQSTVKQLGVIALDASGKELGRAYYVVSGSFTTGHQFNGDTSVQAANSSGNVIGTFEEAPNGGYDFNYTSSYWLYINEANETNFLGKNVKLANYDYGVNNAAVSYKFEIRENAELIQDGANVLSTGIGFYYKAANGTVQQIAHNSVVPITANEYDLYYGAPNSGTLGTQEGVRPSRTMVIYNPAITDYIVRFDPNWKHADIQVYDMSGKLLISEKKVKTDTDFVIKLDGAVKNAYVVKIVADNGEIVNTKILK